MISKTSFSKLDNDGFQAGVKDSIPTVLGYIGVGLAAGVIQKTAGLSIAEIALLSLLMYSGAAQLIIAGMIMAANSVAAIVITVLIVNLRHLLLSAALSPYFRHVSAFKNMLVGSLLTDETFSVAINKTVKVSQISERWMYGLNFSAYMSWLFANLTGAFFAKWITSPESLGLEFALPSLLIGVLVLIIKGRKNIRMDVFVAVLATIIAVIATIYVSGSMGIIIAAMVASTIGMVLHR